MTGAPGDTDEFVAAMLSHASQLYSFARHLTHHHADAQDLVQKTYMKAWASRATFKAGTNLRAWLFTIMRNAAKDHYRQAAARPVDLGLASGDPGTRDADALPSTESAEDTALTELGDADVRAALARLPEDKRLPVLLADVAGFSYREIARILGTPIGTVMSRLHRGRGALRNELRAAVVRSMRNDAVPDGLLLRLRAKFAEPPSSEPVETSGEDSAGR